MQSPVESLTALLVQVGLLIGALGAIATGIASFLKSKTHDPMIRRALELGEEGGKVATLAGQKVGEIQKDMATAISVVSELSPEMKKLLAEKQKNVEYFKERANITTQQLNRLLPLVPKEAQANAIADLPRESTKTLEAVNE